MKKLLIVSFVLTMVLAAVPAFAATGQWWSGPISTIIETITPTVEEPSGNTRLVPTYEKFKGNIYVETSSGNEVLEVTLCGLLGPNEQELEVDFTTTPPSYLPQLVSDHIKPPRAPETLILRGIGTNDNYTTKVTGPAWLDVTGTLIKNASDAVTEIILLGVVKGSGGTGYPYSYLFLGNIDSALTELSSAPTIPCF